MNTKYLLIPKTIKIGFQERYDTYTKKIAYKAKKVNLSFVLLN